MLELLLRDVTDQTAQENFQKIGNFVKSDTILKTSFRHFEFKAIATGTYLMKHHLGFKPTDLLQSWVSGTGTIAWNFDLFTSEDVSLTVEGTVTVAIPTTVRFFLGRYS